MKYESPPRYAVSLDSPLGSLTIDRKEWELLRMLLPEVPEWGKLLGLKEARSVAVETKIFSKIHNFDCPSYLSTCNCR